MEGADHAERYVLGRARSSLAAPFVAERRLLPDDDREWAQRRSDVEGDVAPIL
jgi:hypothetical protein